MNFKFVHNNFNVLDLQKSLAFYKEALGLEETRRIEKPDFTIVYLGDHQTSHRLELTWLKDRKEPYNLGTTNSIWPLKPMTLRLPMPSTKKWAASASRIRLWGFISSRIRTTIGWKSCRRKNKGRT